MMKKLSLLLLFISANVCAFAVQQNTATMITVFPTPYASYNNLYVNKQVDVGLGSQCGLTAGNDSMANCPLTATNVNLMGTLNLDHFTRLNQSSSATIGRGEESAAALQFQNIRINSFAQPVTSINAKQIAVSSTSNGLSMYPSRVTNSVDVMKECPGGVHWETLTDTNNKTGVYLVCGNPNCAEADIAAAQSQVEVLRNTACNDCGTYANASYTCNEETRKVTVNQGACSVLDWQIQIACYTYTWDRVEALDCGTSPVRNAVGDPFSGTWASSYDWVCFGCSYHGDRPAGSKFSGSCPADLKDEFNNQSGFFDIYQSGSDCTILNDKVNNAIGSNMYGGLFQEMGDVYQWLFSGAPTTCDAQYENDLTFFHTGDQAYCSAYRCTKHHK